MRAMADINGPKKMKRKISGMMDDTAIIYDQVLFRVDPSGRWLGPEWYAF
jgi:hypothetical protein